ncbi:MAG: serine protease [Desulfobacteraceae bacterium]|nr:serine protease [Desulfobacteraceae bacterium]MCF8094070.1 serine protease [Desulfobacteraceae bacterium]
MLQNIYFQYKGAAMMLFKKEGEQVAFRGTAFLIHPRGYLLTAAHLIIGITDLMAVPMEEHPGFAPVREETVAPIPLEIRQIDRERDLALLKFGQEVEVSMPDHVMGIPEEVPIGNSVACLGYPFGYYHIYTQLIKQAAVAGKILSKNQTRIFLFDTLIHDGSIGAPLVNLYDGRIIGVVGGRFLPQDLMPEHLRQSAEAPIKTDISYAVSIEHAARLMEKETLALI